MASRSTPQKIFDELVDLREDGSFKLDMKYFAYDYGLTMTNDRFARLFGQPVRAGESKMEQFHWDMAASIQRVTEEIVLRDGARSAPPHAARRTCAWRAAWRSTASRTGGSSARGRSRTSGCSPPPAMRAARSARRSSCTTPCSASRAPSAWTTLLGARVLRRGDPEVPRRPRRAVPQPAPRRDDPRDRPPDRRGAGRRRLAPGAHGVGTALARQPQHPRRRAQPRELAAREPEDQVPRELPAVRAGLPRGEGRRLVRDRPREPVHAARVPGRRPAARSRPSRTSTARPGSRPCGATSTPSSTISSPNSTRRPAARS